MSIQTEKILTISAKEYCESKGKSLKDYKLIGVHCFDGFSLDSRNVRKSPKQNLAEKVGNNAEVVVGYSVQFAGEGVFYEANGTMMIPKSKDGLD